MSSSSTPKRILAPIEDGNQSKAVDSLLKRVRIDGSFTSGSDSESGLGTPCSSFHIQNPTDATGSGDGGAHGAVPLLHPHRSTCELLYLSVITGNIV
jgi:hypothetical protein